MTYVTLHWTFWKICFYWTCLKMQNVLLVLSQFLTDCLAVKSTDAFLYKLSDMQKQGLRETRSCLDLCSYVRMRINFSWFYRMSSWCEGRWPLRAGRATSPPLRHELGACWQCQKVHKQTGNTHPRVGVTITFPQRMPLVHSVHSCRYGWPTERTK